MRKLFLLVALLALLLAGCAPEQSEAPAAPFEVEVKTEIWRNAPEGAVCNVPQKGANVTVVIPLNSGETHDGYVIWDLTEEEGKFTFEVHDLTANYVFKYEAEFRGENDLWIKKPGHDELTEVTSYAATIEGLDLFKLDNLNGVTLHKIVCSN